MRCNNKGFTLIELIMSLALLGLIIAFLFPLFVSGLGYIARAGQRTKAYNFNEGEIDEALNQFYNYGNLISEFDDPAPVPSIDITLDDGSTIAVDGLVLGRKEEFLDNEVVFYFFAPAN